MKRQVTLAGPSRKELGSSPKQSQLCLVLAISGHPRLARSKSASDPKRTYTVVQLHGGPGESNNRWRGRIGLNPKATASCFIQGAECTARDARRRLHSHQAALHVASSGRSNRIRNLLVARLELNGRAISGCSSSRSGRSGYRLFACWENCCCSSVREQERKKILDEISETSRRGAPPK